jgi:lysophospholipase L1-like esterase
MPRTKETKRKLINIFLLVFVTLILIFLIEDVLRAVYPLEHNLEKQHILSDYGIFFREPYSQFTYAPPSKEFSQDIRLNSRGLRDTEHSYKKSSSVYRIAVVGDSFIDGYQVNLADTIPKLLETRLNERGKKSYEVINFGFGGYGPIAEAVLVEEEVLKYEPDMVIFAYYIGNDLTRMDSGAYKEFPSNFWDLEWHKTLKKKVYGNDLMIKMKSFFRRNSMIRFLVKKTMTNIGGGAEGVNDLIPVSKKYYDDEYVTNLKDVRSIFNFLNNLTSEENISFGVVLIPAKEQMNQDDFNEMILKSGGLLDDYDLKMVQQAVSSQLNGLGIEYLDLLDGLRKHTGLYWEIDGHLNEKGYKIAADLIFDWIMETEIREHEQK